MLSVINSRTHSVSRSVGKPVSWSFLRSANHLVSLSPVLDQSIAHFTVSCLVTRPLNESEAGGDLVLIETSLLFSCSC